MTLNDFSTELAQGNSSLTLKWTNPIDTEVLTDGKHKHTSSIDKRTDKQTFLYLEQRQLEWSVLLRHHLLDESGMA